MAHSRFNTDAAGSREHYRLVMDMDELQRSEIVLPLQASTGRGERLVGWLFFVPLAVLAWLLGFGLLALFIGGLFATGGKDGLIIVLGVGVVFAFLGLLIYILSYWVHDILATYEVTSNSIIKRSPFWRQEARWSQVGKWVLSEQDSVWWLSDAKGRLLLGIDWHLLPIKEACLMKAIVLEHILTQLPVSNLPLSLRKDLKYWRWLNAILVIAGIGFHFGWRWAANVGTVASLAYVWLTFLHLLQSGRFSSMGVICVQGNKLVRSALHSDEIELGKVRDVRFGSKGVYLIGEAGQVFFVPRHLRSLLLYLMHQLSEPLTETLRDKCANFL